LRYEGQTFHTKCFLCASCRTELSDRDFFKHEGGRYCSNCIDRVSVGGQNQNQNQNQQQQYQQQQQHQPQHQDNFDNYSERNDNFDNFESHHHEPHHETHHHHHESKPSKPVDDDDDESPVIEYQATIIEPEDNFEVESFGFEVKEDEDDEIDIDINEMINEVDALGTEINASEKLSDGDNDSDDIDSLEDALNSLSTFDS